MEKEKNKRKNSGFAIIEALLSISIFVLLVTALTGGLIYGQESSALSGARARAVFLAEEGLEVVKNIQQEDFVSLVDGMYGLVVFGDQWIFSGASDTTDIFTRQINISTIDTNTKQVISNVTWQQNLQRQGSISLTTYLTNWTETVAVTNMADNLSVDISGATVDPGNNKNIIGITLGNIDISDITISSTTISWTGGPNGNKVKEITMDGSSLWSGNENSGSEINITDLVLLGSSTGVPIDYMGFNKDMTGTVVDIIFTMSDGSTKTVSDILNSGAGGGGEADNLSVDVNGAMIDPVNGERVIGITLENTDTNNIIIASVAISWTTPPNGNKIKEIFMDGSSLWSGNGNSGSNIDIVDLVLLGSTSGVPIDYLEFSKDMSGYAGTIDIVFTMNDGSTQTISGISL